MKVLTRPAPVSSRPVTESPSSRPTTKTKRNSWNVRRHQTKGGQEADSHKEETVLLNVVGKFKPLKTQGGERNYEQQKYRKQQQQVPVAITTMRDVFDPWNEMYVM